MGAMLQLYRGMTRANHQYILLGMHSNSRKQEHDCPLCVKFANDCLWHQAAFYVGFMTSRKRQINKPSYQMLSTFNYTFPKLLTSFEVRYILGRHMYLVTRFWITPLMWWFVI